MQLLACDWILETRTACWETERANIDDDGYWPVQSIVLEKFQRDLNSLRTVVEDIPVSLIHFNLPSDAVISEFFLF